MIGGWSLEPAQVRLGLTRLLYPFFAGLLLSRVVRVGHVKHAFLLSGLIIAVALALPRFGGEQGLWINGLYESVCIIAIFPLVVYLGASGTVQSGMVAKVCGFLGAISYPIYIVHYPFIYTYTAWVANHKVSVSDGLPIMIATWLFCIALAWVCLRYYDIPLRQWLTRRAASKAANPMLALLGGK